VWRAGQRRGHSEDGQSTVEWVALLLLVALLFVVLLATGVRIPGTALVDAIASRVLCAVALAESCGDEPELIAAYGGEVGRLASEHMPTLAFEEGSRALPVDWRRCRSNDCADGPEEGMVTNSFAGMPATAFVHAIDCRGSQGRSDSLAGDAECSGEREGNLYLQYWLYYPDSATLRSVPVAGERGYHADDWESVQVRIGADGAVDQRASSHHGYNYRGDEANLASDAGFGPLRDLNEAIGTRADNGWGPETGIVLVSGGSHAGNVGEETGSRFTPGRRVHLVPLEPIARGDRTPFAVSPPWRKQVWRDPEASGTS
jgi:hypothetical protein